MSDKCRSVRLSIVIIVIVMGPGCSKGVHDVPVQVTPTPAAAHSEDGFQEQLVFTGLPIVDDSEETLKTHDIVELKDNIAVLSQSIGVEGAGGAVDHLLEAGTLIPVEKHDILSTVENRQQEIMMTLVRGNSRQMSKNHLIGKVAIVGIPSASAGVPRIQLILKVQRNGDVIVSASDQATGMPLQ